MASVLARPGLLRAFSCWITEKDHRAQQFIYIGTLLLVVALVALILSMVERNIVAIIAAAAGLAMIIFAWVSGVEFLASQQNSLSLYIF